jgi:hypothetical protein
MRVGERIANDVCWQLEVRHTMKADHDEFVINRDRLTHRPTGTPFWMGETDMGSAGGHLRTCASTIATNSMSRASWSAILRWGIALWKILTQSIRTTRSRHRRIRIRGQHVPQHHPRLRSARFRRRFPRHSPIIYLGPSLSECRRQRLLRCRRVKDPEMQIVRTIDANL